MHRSSPGSTAPDPRSPVQCAAQCRIHVGDPKPPAFAGPSHLAFPAKGRVSIDPSRSPVVMPHNISHLMWYCHRKMKKSKRRHVSTAFKTETIFVDSQQFGSHLLVCSSSARSANIALAYRADDCSRRELPFVKY